MKRTYIPDPTANQAIANVLREQRLAQSRIPTPEQDLRVMTLNAALIRRNQRVSTDGAADVAALQSAIAKL